MENHYAEIDPNEFRPCHDCGRLVRLAASMCRFCGADLVPEPPLPELVERVSKRLQKADKMEEAGTFPHDKAEKYGRMFSGVTCVLWGVLILAPIGILLITFLMANQRDREDVWGPLWALYLFSALFLVPIGIGAIVNDLSVPRDSLRTMPEYALKAFFLAMRHSRWRYAFNLVLPGSRAYYLTPEKVAPDRKGKGMVLGSYESFGKYWRMIMRERIVWVEEGNRKIPYKLSFDGIKLNTTYVGDRNAQVDVDYAFKKTYSSEIISKYILTGAVLAVVATIGGVAISLPIFMGLLVVTVIVFNIFNVFAAKTVCFSTTKFMRRVGEKWYVVCPAMHSGEDQLPELYDDMGALDRGELPDVEMMAASAEVQPLEVEDVYE